MEMSAGVENQSTSRQLRLQLGHVAMLVASFQLFSGLGRTATIYSNNAGTPFVQSFDTVTGNLIFGFTGSGSNGRGVVVVGDVVYTTEASTGNVSRFDRTTGAPLGGRFTIPGAGGISTISFDGDNFWTSDYTGTNQAFYVSPTGVVLKTITLSLSEASMMAWSTSMAN
jgi:hypothetical protein